jgi:hypothetical protein
LAGGRTLADIPLDGENSRTELPYLDIVNEILERRQELLGLPLGEIDDPITRSAARLRGSSG